MKFKVGDEIKVKAPGNTYVTGSVVEIVSDDCLVFRNHYYPIGHEDELFSANPKQCELIKHD